MSESGSGQATRQSTKSRPPMNLSLAVFRARFRRSSRPISSRAAPRTSDSTGTVSKASSKSSTKKSTKSIHHRRPAHQGHQPSPKLEEEVGDLLFAGVNVARFVGVDPEIALKKANRKFKQRFQWMEAAAAREGQRFADLPRDRMEELWNQSKLEAHGSPASLDFARQNRSANEIPSTDAKELSALETVLCSLHRGFTVMQPAAIPRLKSATALRSRNTTSAFALTPHLGRRYCRAFRHVRGGAAHRRPGTRRFRRMRKWSVSRSRSQACGAGKPFLHSHQTAVLTEFHDRGVGRRLKLFQRQDALKRGIDLIEWTFDPLELKNALFQSRASRSNRARSTFPIATALREARFTLACRPTASSRNGGSTPTA